MKRYIVKFKEKNKVEIAITKKYEKNQEKKNNVQKKK